MRDEPTTAKTGLSATPGPATPGPVAPGPAPTTRRAPAPGADTLAALALGWLLVLLLILLAPALRALGDGPATDASNPLTITRVALELPQMIAASLIAGIALGLVAVNLLARFAPSAPRLLAGAAGGLVTGLAVGTPILLGYRGLPSVLVLSAAVATAATLGGLLAGLRHPTVVAAGACGALGVFLIGLLEQAFQGNLRQLFGAGETPESVLAASGWVVLTASLAAGAVAGVLGYLYLRRCGPDGLRWPAYLVAGAMPGLLVLVAEAVTRLGGARLFQLVGEASDMDQAVLAHFHSARLYRAMIVLFVGAVVAIYLFGRTLRPGRAAGEVGGTLAP